MNKIGLALSGGGFRASLYHLGLIRFLRDAGILPQVTHITSVSGGSIIAAHLVLNWDRYNGSPTEFEAAACELLSFVRLDVRNRITSEDIMAGKPVMQSQLGPEVQTPFLAELPAGMRAIGVAVDPSGEIQKYIHPGDHVDVMVVVEDKNEDGLSTARKS